jgi:hypothetical protein
MLKSRGYINGNNVFWKIDALAIRGDLKKGGWRQIAAMLHTFCSLSQNPRNQFTRHSSHTIHKTYTSAAQTFFNSKSKERRMTRKLVK